MPTNYDGPTQGQGYGSGTNAVPDPGFDIKTADLQREAATKRAALEEGRYDRERAIRAAQAAIDAQAAIEAKKAIAKDVTGGVLTARHFTGEAECDGRVIYAAEARDGRRTGRIAFEQTPSRELVIMRVQGSYDAERREVLVPIDPDGWRALKNVFESYGKRFEGPERAKVTIEDIAEESLGRLVQAGAPIELFERVKAAFEVQPPPPAVPGASARRRYAEPASPDVDRAIAERGTIVDAEVPL